MLGAFVRDLRFAARLMRRSPAFSAAVVLTLALGVGATTAMFSVVYGVLLRPLPYRDADRLVMIRLERALEGVQRPARTFFPLADLAHLRSATHVFDSIAFYSTEPSILSHDGFTQTVDAAWVSESFFPMVGGRLKSGRGLTPSNIDRASVVISERLGRRLFGLESPVGRPVIVGKKSYEIVGVADPTLQLPGRQTDVWLPAVELECCSYAAIGRLAPRVSESQAAADVTAVVPALAAKTPRLYAGVQVRVVALRDEITGDVRAALWVLLASVGLLLGVACANATNLVFSRNAARVRETAVRTALGASRGRILAQSLAEAAMAVAAAAALGLILASGLIDGFTALGSPGFPRLDADAVRIDLPVFAFALIIVSATTLVMGTLPIMRSGSVMSALKAGVPGMSAGPNRRRLQNGLVIGQLAVSVVLLVGASLLGRSFVRLMTTDIGVRTDRVATAAIDLAYQRSPTDAQQAALVDDIVERVRSLPDVQAAGVGASLPPRASTIRLTLKRSGDAVDYQAIAIPATPGYFAALGVRPLKGRLFTEADVETGTQVMIMTADTAQRFFDTNDPIGRTMPLPVLRNGITRTAEVTLVGVIANVKHSGLQAAPDDAIYRPLRQQHWPSLFVVGRTSADPQVLASALRREIAAVDPGIAVSSVNTLDEIVATETAQPRFNSALLTGLATLTLAIASIGLYGVVAHTVSQRTREFGVRMALGADRTSLLRLVFREGARLAGAGIALGVAASLVTSRMLTSLLYGIGPTDALSFGLASGLLLLVAAAATFIPARRAARLDPTAALRAE